MAYIIFVNPEILSTTGMDRNAVFVATCLAAALGSAIMGFWRTGPSAWRRGWGLNAFLPLPSWGVGLYPQTSAGGGVHLGAGVPFLLGDRHPRWLIAGILTSMRSAIAAGIGMFLGLIALKNAGTSPTIRPRWWAWAI